MCVVILLPIMNVTSCYWQYQIKFMNLIAVRFGCLGQSSSAAISKGFTNVQNYTIQSARLPSQAGYRTITNILLSCWEYFNFHENVLPVKVFWQFGRRWFPKLDKVHQFTSRGPLDHSDSCGVKPATPSTSRSEAILFCWHYLFSNQKLYRWVLAGRNSTPWRM